MTFHFHSYKNFHNIVGVEMNNKSSDILRCVFRHLYDLFFPKTWNALIFCPPYSYFHSGRPFSRNNDTAYKCSTATIRIDTWPGVTIHGECRNGIIRII